MLEFKVGTSNNIYEGNVGTPFKILNNVKSCTPLNVLTLWFSLYFYLILLMWHYQSIFF
jgi:hypothetical protein